ncbi:MAG TPA: DUF2746 domain-containing protein [Actinomycetota bacterium]|nr:DUF2746 domain-containing protein [Actinomycetota bacterium]
MNTIPNPDSWMDVATIIVVALIAGLPAWLALRSHKEVRKQGESVEAIRGQVVNGHERPMRADLDALLVAMETLREAVEDERALRREQIHELRADIDSRFASLHQQISSIP